jgi:hypothetical protein
MNLPFNARDLGRPNIILNKISAHATSRKRFIDLVLHIFYQDCFHDFSFDRTLPTDWNYKTYKDLYAQIAKDVFDADGDLRYFSKTKNIPFRNPDSQQPIIVSAYDIARRIVNDFPTFASQEERIGLSHTRLKRKREERP